MDSELDLQSGLDLTSDLRHYSHAIVCSMLMACVYSHNLAFKEPKKTTDVSGKVGSLRHFDHCQSSSLIHL